MKADNALVRASAGADICGRLAHSTPCAWSVLLSTGRDCDGEKGLLGC